MGRRVTPGFTIIELLVAVAITMGVLAASYACLYSGFESRELVETRADLLQGARVAMRLVTSDLRNAVAFNADAPFIGMNRTVAGIEADNVDFATLNWTPEAEGEGDVCEVSYYIDRHPESGALGLWRRRDSSPDDEPYGGGLKEEIAVGIRGLRFEYYDGYEWFDEWGETDGYREERNSIGLAGNLYGMPDAVRITLLFESRDPGVPGKTRRGETRRSGSREDHPPPVAFQTVVYLNLADRIYSGRFAASNEGTESAGTSGSGGN